MADVPGIAGYANEAPALAIRYERYGFERAHKEVLHLFPQPPALVLDIGAGTGRDAAALSRLGYRVTAVEPVAEMRAEAARLHGDCAVDWIDDGLPDLASLKGRDGEFGLIMLTAVFMHLNAPLQEKSLKTIARLVEPGGLVRMMLRHGPVPKGRTMFDVSSARVCSMGAPLGLVPVFDSPRSSHSADKPEVTWTDLMLKKL